MPQELWREAKGVKTNNFTKIGKTEAGANTQSPLQKSNFGTTSRHELRKIRYQSLLIFNIVLKILSAILGMKSREMGRKS